jgi:hypothetical protein
VVPDPDAPKMWILSGSGTYSLSIGAAPLSTVWSWGMIRGVGCETPCREGRAIAVRDAKIQKQTHFEHREKCP